MHRFARLVCITCCSLLGLSGFASTACAQTWPARPLKIIAPFDAATAFTPVTVVADMPMVLVVRNDVAARDVKEFIALNKSTSGGLFFGSPGNGTTGHLGMELFMHAAGVKLQHG